MVRNSPLTCKASRLATSPSTCSLSALHSGHEAPVLLRMKQSSRHLEEKQTLGTFASPCAQCMIELTAEGTEGTSLLMLALSLPSRAGLGAALL